MCVFVLCVAVNGGWSPWSEWQLCHCPGGAAFSAGQKRTRACISPPPSNGGLDCVGVNVQKTKECRDCPPGKREPHLDPLFLFFFFQ